MVWYQLQIEVCTREEVDLLSDALELSGALSITYSDKNDVPVLEPAPGTTPLWPDVVVTALYADEAIAIETRNQLIKGYPHLTSTIQPLADQDWIRAWMDDFKPIRFGDRLWVCPSWLEPPEPNAVNLILDPGLAFGTGTHPTTSLCLHWLGSETLTDQRVIDYGCGSGILAIAALKLGARTVQAVDIDDQALTATDNNAKTNAITSSQLQIGQPESLQGAVDLILANILLSPLMDLKERFKSLLKPSARLVVSGILADQAQALIDCYQDSFIHQHTLDQEGWSLLIFINR